MCLLANTNPEAKAFQDKSLFCLPMDTPGITVSRTIDKIGMHASDTAQVQYYFRLLAYAYNLRKYAGVKILTWYICEKSASLLKCL